jgi:hypothetical protein
MLAVLRGRAPLDLAVTYTVPVAKRLRPWVKAEVRNMFNAPAHQLQHHDAAGSGQPQGCPRHPDGLHQGQRFRDGTATANYPFPREFFISTGIRF